MENEFLKLWIFVCSQAFPTFSDKPIPVFSPKNATLISYCWLFFADPKQVNLSISVGLYKPMTTLRYIVDGGLSNICCTSVPAFRRIRLMTLEVTDFVHSWHCQYHYCHQYLHCCWWMLAIESHQSSLRTRLFLIIVDCVTWYPRRTPWNYHVPNPYLRTPEGIYIYIYIASASSPWFPNHPVPLMRWHADACIVVHVENFKCLHAGTLHWVLKPLKRRIFKSRVYEDLNSTSTGRFIENWALTLPAAFDC